MKSLFQTDSNTDNCNVIYKQSSLFMTYVHQYNKDKGHNENRDRYSCQLVSVKYKSNGGSGSTGSSHIS